MKSRHLRRGLAATAAISVGLALSACSNSMGSTAAPALTGKAPTGVTLTMWHITSDSPALLNLYKAYEKSSGNTIQLVDIPSDTFPMTVQSKWATGDRPDILEWHGNLSDVQSLNPKKNLTDLSSLAFVKKQGTLGDLSASVDGVHYGVTLGPLSVFGLFYNKKVVKDAGIKLPTSYADLATACTAIKSSAPGVAPIYMGGGSGFPPALLAGFNYMAEYNADTKYAKDVASGAVKISDPKGPLVAGMNSFLDLKKNGCFNSDATTATFENALKAVLNGKAAFTALPSDMISLLNGMAGNDKDKVDAAVGWAAVSATKATAAFSPSPAGTYYVPKTGDDEKERAAADFINYVSGKGYQKYVDEAGIVPTLSGFTTPKLQGLSQEVEATQKDATLAVNSDIPGFGNFGSESDKLLAGQETPQQVADQMQSYYKAAAAALGK